LFYFADSVYSSLYLQLTQTQGDTNSTNHLIQHFLIMVLPMQADSHELYEKLKTISLIITAADYMCHAWLSDNDKTHINKQL